MDKFINVLVADFLLAIAICRGKLLKTKTIMTIVLGFSRPIDLCQNCVQFMSGKERYKSMQKLSPSPFFFINYIFFFFFWSIFWGKKVKWNLQISYYIISTDYETNSIKKHVINQYSRYYLYQITFNRGKNMFIELYYVGKITK